MIDWTFALLFRPDTVKISLDTEAASLLREAAADGVGAEPRDKEDARIGMGAGSRQQATGASA